MRPPGPRFPFTKCTIPNRMCGLSPNGSGRTSLPKLLPPFCRYVIR
jgi:hypothetical protein